MSSCVIHFILSFSNLFQNCEFAIFSSKIFLGLSQSYSHILLSYYYLSQIQRQTTGLGLGEGTFWAGFFGSTCVCNPHISVTNLIFSPSFKECFLSVDNSFTIEFPSWVAFKLYLKLTSCLYMLLSQILWFTGKNLLISFLPH